MNAAGPTGPARLYVVTGGRRDPGRRDTGVPELDLVTLVRAGDAGPRPGAPSEHERILRLCRRRPVAVVELASHLGLPVSVLRVLLRDLLADGLVTAGSPAPALGAAPADRGGPDMETLKQVLVGLRDL